jgi:PadR family transcriptional regulator PadR
MHPKWSPKRLAAREPTLFRGIVSDEEAGAPQPFRGALAGAGTVRHSSHQHFRGNSVATVDLDLLQGTLDLLILKTLTWGPRHGYAVASWIRETTNQRLQIEEGALYTALHRMEKRGWLEAEWGLSENNRKAKYYQLTTQGRKQLRSKTTVWTEYASAVFQVLQTS